MTKSLEAELEAIGAKLVAGVAREREKEGMSRSELSEAIGGYRNLITKLETGQRKLDAALFVIIAKGLKLKPSTLMRRALEEDGEA